jgi:hypothetical protein
LGGGLKKINKFKILEFSEMARTFIEKFLGQPLLGEKVRAGRERGEREEKIMVLIEATTFSTSAGARQPLAHALRSDQ